MVEKFFLAQDAASKKRFLLISLSLSFLLHLPFLNNPPQSIHVWRQCNTLAVARNFYEESMNILQPRTDDRQDTKGVTGMPFPLYEWGVACVYKVTGFQDWVSRVVQFCWFSLGVWAFYELIFLCWGSALAAALGAWCLIWSPELFYFGICALPDIAALSLSLTGLVFFLKWLRNGKPIDGLLGFLTVTLGGMTKPQYLAVGFPMLVLLWQYRKKPYSLSRWIQGAVFGVFSLGSTLGWYAYARYLQEMGVDKGSYKLTTAPASSLAWGIHTLFHNAVSEFPELILNYANFILVLVGFYFFIKKRKWVLPFFVVLAAWFGGLVIYYFSMFGQMGAHSYYLIPFLPCLLFGAVSGALELKAIRSWALVLLLVIQPVLACVRILPPRFFSKDKAVPMELYDKASRTRLQQAVPEGSLCVVGPDNSGCIYYYFLHKKGFCFNQVSNLEAISGENNEIQLEYDIRHGAKYLYTDDPGLKSNPKLASFLKKKVFQEGAFEVYELKVPGLSVKG